jgi:O-antigen/teichoic acid export membrane protein
MAHNSRKKSLFVTAWIYIGFGIGAINTLLFANNHIFSTTEYGLTRSMTDIAILLSSFASLGAPTYMLKLYPYYTSKIAANRNDLFSNGLKLTLIGFVLVLIATLLAKPIIVIKYSKNAALLVNYFYWVIPLLAGYIFYNLLDGYGWNLGLQLYTNIIREVFIRLYTLLLITFYFLKIIEFDVFIKVFCFQYLLACGILLYLIHKIEPIHLSWKISSITQKFRKPIKAILLFGFFTTMVGAIRIGFDSLVLASVKGLEETAIYTFVGFVASLVYAPFRSLISVYFPQLVTAWKIKNYNELNRIYQRSAINMLIFSLLIFGIIWIGFDAAVDFFNLNTAYKKNKFILLVLCLVNIVELGTGLNAQIIQSSTHWRFEFYTNLLLGIMIAPFTYWFTKSYGTIGPAYAQLLGISIYNAFRIRFLHKRYGFSPFSKATVYCLLLFSICFLPFIWWGEQPLLITILKCFLFGLGFILLNFKAKTSPDLIQLYYHLKNRLVKK